jgi:hypothetical protein
VPRPVTDYAETHIAGRTPKLAGSYIENHSAKTEIYIHSTGAELQKAGSTQIKGAKIQQPENLRREESERSQ